MPLDAARRAAVIRPDPALKTDAGFFAATFDLLPASIAVIDLTATR
jgi:hypothetical protein